MASQQQGTSSSSTGWSKWQVAALVGLGLAATSAVVGGYWLWSARKKKQRQLIDATRDEVVPVSVESTSPPKENSHKDVPVTKSLLEQALEAKLRGNELFKQKKFEEAIKCYEEALHLCPKDNHKDIAAFQHNIAAALENMVLTASTEEEKMALWKRVQHHCTEALLLDHRYIKPLVRRAHANEALGQKREALLDITRLIILDEQQIKSFAESTQRLLKSISKELADENYKKLGPLEPPAQLVRAYFKTYSWTDDISKTQLQLLWDSIDEDKDKFNAEPFVIAANQFRSGQYSGLLELLTQSIDNGHDVFKSHALLLRGSLYCLWRQDEVAVTDLKAVLDVPGLKSEMYADVHVKLAAIYAGLSDMTLCYEEFDKAIKIKPDHADVYIQRARVAMESDDPSIVLKARDDLEIALKLAPNIPHTLYCLGSVYHRGGLLSRSVHFLEEARSKFEEAYKNFPSCVEGIILFSLFLQDVEEVGRSEQLLKEAVRIEPDNASAHFSLSILYLVSQQDISKAIQSLETAIAMDSSCIQAYETLASLEMQRGNQTRAGELYELAINNSRSILEMQQAYLAREVYITQNQVCQEYGINPMELVASRIAKQQQMI